MGGLAALNFFPADVQGGLGPFLATWLAATGWDPECVGSVMTISGLAGLVFNSPAGMLIDVAPRFRMWVAVASLAILAGTLATWVARAFDAILAAQIASSLGGALMAPAITALTLGIVGKQRFPVQQGRNQAWSHAGMVVAMAAGRAADRINRGWLLLIACLVLPIRGAMAALAKDPAWLVPIQVLDACGAGTLGVVVPILVADFTWGSGRTQSALGLIAMLQGIGAALSASLGGLLATQLGWSAAFSGLAVPSLFALALALRLLGHASNAKAAAISLRV